MFSAGLVLNISVTVSDTFSGYGPRGMTLAQDRHYLVIALIAIDAGMALLQ